MSETVTVSPEVAATWAAQKKAKADELVATRKDIAKRQHEIKSQESNIMAEITGALTADGKKLFGNAESRDAELQKRVECNPVLKSMHDEVQLLQDMVGRLQNDFDYCRDMYEIQMAFAGK